MKINRKKCFSVVFILFLAIFHFYFINSFIFLNLNTKNNCQNEENKYKLKQSQIRENSTMSSSLNKFIWIEGQLNLVFYSNESGSILCEFKDNPEGKYFYQIKKSINLTDNNEGQEIKLIFKPYITTLPGKYNFTLTISGIYNYSENFEIIFGMGYIILFLILTIFGISIIVILLKKYEFKELKSSSITSQDSTSESIIKAHSSKIKCPECGKQISEGLTFCPECGCRIPEFLRFNPDTVHGL